MTRYRTRPRRQTPPSPTREAVGARGTRSNPSAAAINGCSGAVNAVLGWARGSTMRHRLFRLAGSAVLAAAAAGWSAGALSAQAPLRGSVPQTSDGHPDLQGFYDVATITPLQRPPGVSKLVLTPQEAAAMEQYEAQRNAANAGPVPGDRPAPPVGGDTSTPKSFLE